MHRYKCSRPPALVAGLLRLGRPAHVPRSIRTIVVDAVKGAPFRARPQHLIEIPQEDCYVAPFRTHGDASCAVVAVGPMGGVPTPVDHVAPAVVAGVTGQAVRAVGQSLRRTPRLGESGRHASPALHASARSGAVRPEQRLKHHRDLLAAVALADGCSPLRFSGLSDGRGLDDDQPPEAVFRSDYVFRSHAPLYVKGL